MLLLPHFPSMLLCFMSVVVNVDIQYISPHWLLMREVTKCLIRGMNMYRPSLKSTTCFCFFALMSFEIRVSIWIKSGWDWLCVSIWIKYQVFDWLCISDVVSNQRFLLNNIDFVDIQRPCSIWERKYAYNVSTLIARERLRKLARLKFG